MLDWTHDEVEMAKDLFRTGLWKTDGATVRRGPTEVLWRHWDATGLEPSLFGDPEEDLALLLYARAYGLSTPWVEDPGPCGELLRAHQDRYAALVEPPLPLGARANLSPARCAALESPILDVWVYRDGTTPLRVLIFGAGLPGIREQVLGDAFMTSLRLGTSDSHFVGVGAVQVEVGAAQRPVAPPINVLGAAGALVPPAATAQEAMDGFVARLKQLADRSGLIRLHDADDAAYRELWNAVAQRANPGPDDPPTVWAPGRGSDGAALAVLVPCFRFAIPQRHIPGARRLELRLSRDLLGGDTYQALARSYRGNTLDRLLDDARRRHDFHAAETQRLRRNHRDYEATPEQDRAAVWGATVTLTHYYDFDTQRSIRMAFPEEVSADDYYLEQVPRQADRHDQAAKEMQQVVNDVAAAEASQEAPIPRLTAGCLLDAALRGRRPVGSAAFAKAFEGWAGRVLPLLCFEWRRFLRAEGIDEPADVFSHHTVVQTDFDVDQETLLQSPSTVVDRRHSAILVDHARGVVVVRDPTDRPRGEADASAAAATAEAGGDDKGKRWWGRLVEAADRPDTKPAAFGELLLAALRDAPEHVLGKVMEALSGARTGEERAKATEEVTELESILAAAVREFAVPYGMRRAWTALGVFAPHTVRTQLAAVRDTPGTLGAQVALTEAVAEFLWSGRPTTDAYDCFTLPAAAGLPDRFEQAVVRARQRDPRYTAQWIGLLVPERQLDFHRVAQRLLLGLREPGEHGKPQQRAALLSQTGAEAARLARDLEQAAEMLDDDGEPVATAFAKLGQALEALFLAEFAGGIRDEAVALLEILTARAGGAGTHAED